MWYMGHGHPILMIDPIKMLTLPQRMADHAEAHPSCDHICDEWNPFFHFSMNLKHMNISMGCTQLEEPTNIGKPIASDPEFTPNWPVLRVSYTGKPQTSSRIIHIQWGK